MIAVFLSTFVPGLLRIVRYVFQLSYYVVHGQFCEDVNPYPYLMIMGVIFLLTFTITLGMRNRLTRSEPHNLVFLLGSLSVLVFPTLTMEMNWNPCAFINLPDAPIDVIIG